MTKNAIRIAALLCALACLFVRATRADVRGLVNDSKITWSGSPTVIYLNDDGTTASAAAYKHLVLKFTDTSTAGSLTIGDTVRASARVLVVGGGGAGGTSKTTTYGCGGGGGAGGLIETNLTLVGDTYAIAVGAGGQMYTGGADVAVGENGTASSFAAVTAKGGGGGGAQSVGNDGASGGGGSSSYNTSTSAKQNNDGGVGESGQGHNGGAGKTNKYGGGGGGAGDDGGNTSGADGPGEGGIGIASDILLDELGQAIYYAGGGSGGSGVADMTSNAGKGGGGRGAGKGDSKAGNGTDGLGGGGGGGGNVSVGGKGGDGVVIVRITDANEVKVDVPVINDLTYTGNNISISWGNVYEYVSGTTNATVVDNYSFFVRPATDCEWKDNGGSEAREVPWKIVQLKLDMPTVATDLVYGGTNQVGVVIGAEAAKYCELSSGSATNATNAGVYNYTISIKSEHVGNVVWDDDSTEAKGSWTIAQIVVTRPMPNTGLAYDGTEKQGFSSLDYARYKLTAGETNATAGGSHPFTFKLLGNDDAENYVWDTNPRSAEPYSGEWTIAPAANAVTVSMDGWRLNTTPNEPTIMATWGSNTVHYAYGLGENAGDITDWVDSTSLINTDGVWTVMAMIDATANWNGATNTAQFTIWDDPIKLFRDSVDIKIAGATETLTNFPALVRISEKRLVGFLYSRAGSDGSNLVFLDGDNSLPHEVDTWSPSGESLVWVLIPELPPEGKTITMAWNLKEGRTPPKNDPKQVWNDNYVGVWHMNASGKTIADTTGHNNGTLSGSATTASGKIGSAASYPTSGAYITCGTTQPNSELVAGFTVAGWINSQSYSGRKDLFGKNAFIAIRTESGASSLTVTTPSIKDHTVSTSLPAAGSWFHYALTFVPGTSGLNFYINGNLVNTQDASNLGNQTAAGEMWLGKSQFNYYFTGLLDEYRLSKTIRSKGWIEAEYATVADEGFSSQASAVVRDGVKLNYWLVEPAMDKTLWDAKDTPGVVTNLEKVALAFGGVSNVVYSVYDPTQTFESTTNITEAGYYRIVFLPTETEGYEPISYAIDIHVVKSQPYTNIGGTNGDSGRILLMNRDRNSACPIENQSDDVTGKGRPTFWQFINKDGSGLPYNLRAGTETILWKSQYSEKLWHLINCRHGNTNPQGAKGVKDINGNVIPATYTKTPELLDDKQNYLPYSTSSYDVSDEDTRANPSTAGQIVMRNMGDTNDVSACAVVYSSCFTNGIGTIYFDAVNGWCRPTEDYDSYKLVVEIATNTIDKLHPPTDEYSDIITTTTNFVPSAVDAEVLIPEVTTVTNQYANLEWIAVTNMIPFKRDGTSNFVRESATNELRLAVTTGGTMDNFYRVVVPLDISDPIRFRIRRVSYDVNYSEDTSSFILLDNVIASIPAMRGDLVSAGHRSEEKRSAQVLGWELATSVPYPSIGDDEITGYAKPVFTLNVGDGTTPDTNKFFASATMHYCWRYLNQTNDVWKSVELDPDDGFKSYSALDLPVPLRAGDVEYWFEYWSQAPFYKYVDYSGASNAAIDYTEDRGILTNKLNAAGLESCGTDWFFRVRDGKSDYSGFDIVYRRGESAAPARAHMSLVSDHVWRGFVQTMTNQVGQISYRVEALDRQTEPFAEYSPSTNYLYCTTENPTLPVSDALYDGTDESWSTLTLDAATGYVMFQIDDSASPMALTIVHADYQNFNAWSDAFGSIFVGNSTEDAAKSGTSPKKREFVQDFDTWNAMPATDVDWQFSHFPDIRYMLDRTAYEPFASDSDSFWSVGPGMWVSKMYKNDTDGSGVALQMEGCGKGYLQFIDKDAAPRGIESIKFNARLGQFVRLEDFSYYWGDNISAMQNYTFITRSAFDCKSNRFRGNASLSLIANYVPTKGCYEARFEWIGTALKDNVNNNRGQRLCLYRWNVNGSTGKTASTLIAAWTNNVAIPNGVDGFKVGNKYLPYFISVSNATDRVYVMTGVRLKKANNNNDNTVGIALNQQPWDSGNDGANWYGICYIDNTANRLKKGTYGVLSANCEGVFAKPQIATGVLPLPETPSAGQSKPFTNKPLNISSLFASTDTYKSCVDDFKGDEPNWFIKPGRMATTNSTTDVDLNAIWSSAPAQKLQIYFGTAGRADWDKPAWEGDLDGFGDKSFNLSFYTNANCSVKFAVAGDFDDVRTDVVIDSVSIRQWRGDNYTNVGRDIVPDWIDPYEDSTTNPGYGMTNWIFTSAWTTNTVSGSGSNVKTNGMILLSAKRTQSGAVSSIRSPLMDGYDMGQQNYRGIGLGMVSYNYENAQKNARLLVQIATNKVDRSRLKDLDALASGSWTTIATNDFSKMTDAERKSGNISTYIGLHGVKGLMRIVVDPALVDEVAGKTDPSEFGEVFVSKVVCRDEPPLDSGCWWGWNLRTVGTIAGRDEEKKMFLPDFALDPVDVGMSLALNNSVTADVDEEDKETYKQNVPFVQTPTFTSNIVGEVAFKARKYDVNKSQPASVTLYGMDTSSGTERWVSITNFVVTANTYEPFSYKTDPGSNYAAFRLGVSGVKDVSGSGLVVPVEYDDPVRVLIDEVFVCEAVRARMAFRNVGAFRSKLSETGYVPNVPSAAEQPLCNEGWGVQCEVFAAQLENEIDTTRPPAVILHWFEGDSPWGFGSWKDKTVREGHHQAPLAPATGTNLIYRSSYQTASDAVIPMSTVPGTIIQYMLEVRYYQVGSTTAVTNWLAAGSRSEGWERPSWYRGVDYNADLGGNRIDRFAAYNILDTVPPGWAWINEVNIYGLYNDEWDNDEDDAQFVEIAVPVESDITGWKVRLLGANTEDKSGTIVTNIIAEFGTSELPGAKPGNIGEASRMVFRVIACPKAMTSGTLKTSDGTLDATWDFSQNYTDTFMRNGRIMEVDPFGIQLVRPSNIVEHEITCIGTNFYGSMVGYEQYYSPTNTVEYFRKHMRDSGMFYAGEDCGNRNAAGNFRSLGVFTGNGATSNEWNNTMKRTPGHINEEQTINSDLRPTPNGESILVFCSLDPTVGHIRQTVGDAVETNTTQTIYLKRGSDNGTNIVYTVDQWYELASVTTNGQFASFTSLAEPRKYVVTVGVGASNNVSVIASAKVEDRLQRDFGLTDDNRYTTAILDWLTQGTDLYGNKWPNGDSGEIFLADFIRPDNSVITNLNLTQMYWLDMDPTIGNLALKGYVSDGPSLIGMASQGGTGYSNLRFNVFMQITNRASGAAWAPYALRGLEPGMSSFGYTNRNTASGWKSATFKMVGFILNEHTGIYSRDNWVPLRWFVFTPESFRKPGSAKPFTCTIDIVDPFSKSSPAWTAGWYDWAQEHGKPQDFYFWCLDERLEPISVEVLKEENPCE